MPHNYLEAALRFARIAIAVVLLVCVALPWAAAAEPDRLPMPLRDRHAPPEYPIASRRLNQEGNVVVTFTVTEDGAVSHPIVTHSSGFPLLDQAVLDAVGSWRYTPAMHDDKPVAVPRAVAIPFSLSDPIVGVDNALNDDCSGSSGKPLEARVEACTEVLASKDLASGDQVVALRRRGAAKIALHYSADALTDLNAALALAPDDYRCLVDRANAYMALRQFQQAIADLDRAIQLRPDNGFLYISRAKASLELNRYEAALDDSQKAIDNLTGYAEPYFVQARIFLAQHDYARALAIYDHIRSLEGVVESPYLLTSRCYARALSGHDLDAALADCNRALTMYHDPATFEARGLVYFRTEKYDLALADLNAAVMTRTSYYLRGLIRLKMGDKSGGANDIDLAKRGDPSIAETFAGHGVKP